jgi:hypothetical protein
MKKKYIVLLFLSFFASDAVLLAKVKGRPISKVKIESKPATNCPITTAQVDLNINQVRARILSAGDLWWDPIGQTPYYEVPKGSKRNSLYCGAIWIGGYDQNNQLLVAAQTYRATGANDFWGGPISKDPSNGSTSITDQRCLEFDKLWNIKKSDIQNFLLDGTTTPDIETWPGNGNVANGELPNLAPFFDASNNGVYNYTEGDYPYFKLDNDYPVDATSGDPICNDYLFGDQCVWWVFNDVGSIKTETSSQPIGLEIRAQAFAFDTEDELDFMTFYKYQIINRSSSGLDSTYFGIWTDSDLGNATDDYVGCDVGLGLGFTYNGDPDDDGGGGYGLNPPAVGIDFLQGPLADLLDSIDNNKDGRIDEYGEEITMSHFVYYEGSNSPVNSEPDNAGDYYGYLRGRWKNEVNITYGGGGYFTGPGATSIPCDYMFPGNSDPKFYTPWTMETANIQPSDMRWLQSVGAFTLAPGAVNYISTGVIWARATVGGPAASIAKMKRADVYAQQLFNRCFQTIEGPKAPDLAIREMDQQIILSLEHTRNAEIELFNLFDKSTPGVIPVFDNGSIVSYDTLSVEDRKYKFQGYRIYQVLNPDVTDSDLNDVSKARLISQVDLNDSIKQLINFKYEAFLNAYVPEMKTDEVNEGITHNFMITQDLFSLKPIVNYRPYYFMVISYASNNFNSFNPITPNIAFSQAEPYLQGKKNVKVYSAIPHKQVVNNGGMVTNLKFGDGFKIKRIEGTGNGGNVLDLTDESVNEILSSVDHRAVNPVYQPGRGPIHVTTYDPIRLKGGGFRVQFNGVETNSRYFIKDLPSGNLIDSSFFEIGTKYEQLVENNKLAFTIYKVNGHEPGDGNVGNGFLEATKTYTNSSAPWLGGVADSDVSSEKNWILSGEEDTDLGDAKQDYESVIGGTWAPYKVAARLAIGSPKLNTSSIEGASRWSYLASVDVVLTNDKSKWSRCVVVETGEDNMPNIGSAKKFDKRKQASVDKNGNTGDGVISSDPNDAEFISDQGMGWFPGYAINIETGERLNIVFGENSSLVNENSTDMLWNPTSNEGYDANGRLAFGGMHYIYIFNKNGIDSNDVTIYDHGVSLNSMLSKNTVVGKRNAFKDCIWTSLPLLNAGYSVLESNVKIRLRVVKDYKIFYSIGATAVNNSNPLYEFEVTQSEVASAGQTELAKSALDFIHVVPNPYYAYSTYESTRVDQANNRVRITNLPSKCTVSIYTINGTLVRQFKRDVPSDVTDGEPVIAGNDFNLASTLDWDLKNENNKMVSSGIYIIHVDAGVLGEKVVKWFGIMRDGFTP